MIEVLGYGVGGGEWLFGGLLMMMLGFVVLIMVIIYFMFKVIKVIFVFLVGIVIIVIIVIVFGFDVLCVGDMVLIVGGLL